MPPNRKQHLYNQYVLSIINDGSVRIPLDRYLHLLDIREFTGVCKIAVGRLSKDLGEPMPPMDERAYIALEVWEYLDGEAHLFLEHMSASNGQKPHVRRLLQERQQPTAPTPEPQKEEPVNQTTTAFETRHFVYGLDVANMSAGQLIDAIKRIEAEIADLKGVKAKSEHLKKRITELEGMLAKVVEVLDAK